MQVPGSAAPAVSVSVSALTGRPIANVSQITQGADAVKRKIENVFNPGAKKACNVSETVPPSHTDTHTSTHSSKPSEKRNLGRNERSARNQKSSGAGSDVPSHILMRLPNSEDSEAMAAWIEERKRRYPRRQVAPPSEEVITKVSSEQQTVSDDNLNSRVRSHGGSGIALALGYSDSEDSDAPPEELPIRKNIFSLNSLLQKAELLNESSQTLTSAQLDPISISSTAISPTIQNIVVPVATSLDPSSVGMSFTGLLKSYASDMASDSGVYTENGAKNGTILTRTGVTNENIDIVNENLTESNHSITPAACSTGHLTNILAEESSVTTGSGRPCRHFLRGHCRQGAQCIFLHDTTLRDQVKERQRQRQASLVLKTAPSTSNLPVAGKVASTSSSDHVNLLTSFGSNGTVRNPFSNSALHTAVGSRKKNISLGAAIAPPAISLLRKLTANDILKEQNKILQCFRFIVDNNFFIQSMEPKGIENSSILSDTATTNDLKVTQEYSVDSLGETAQIAPNSAESLTIGNIHELSTPISHSDALDIALV